MNNPASKEPSMDEILSSIRQIIADEDGPQEQVAPAGATVPAQSEAEADDAMIAAQPAAGPVLEPVPAAAMDDAAAEPLALTPDQMIGGGSDELEDDGLDIDFSPASSGMEANAPPSMEPEKQPEPVVEDIVPEVEAATDTPEEITEEAVEMVITDDIAFDNSEAEPEPEIAPTPMPDPDLSTEMANKLLAPTTDAAVRHTFSKLGALGIGDSELTLEGLVRDMLRPMLKEWLDENLPATVERMVEKEIERVSRGS